MKFRQFEREFLRVAFTTSVELSPASLAFVASIPVREAEQHMQTLVSHGVLELTSDDEGHLEYNMPDRPAQPMALDDPALVGLTEVVTRPVIGPHGASQALVVRRMSPAVWHGSAVSSGQAVASMFLNAMVCPGVGSLVGGKTATGLAQLTLFLVGLPLAVVTIGLPMMLAAWVWGVATSAQLIAEARD